MPTSTLAGNTPGRFQVDSNGCAAYSIQIAVPPGTAGMAPSLALEYSSAGSAYDCVIGLGWNLRGLSAIARAGATFAQDGFIRPVMFDSGDRFVLDGQRLQPATGEYGAADAVYHTEVESWQQITPTFSAAASTANGPDGFIVQDRSGNTLEFGQTPDSRVPGIAGGSTLGATRVWALNRVSDRCGNTMDFRYTVDAANSAYYPRQILYTSNSNLSASRVVDFTYEPRPDQIPHFVAGCTILYTQRLRAIQTSVKGIPVKTYSLEYQTGQSTGRSQLVSIAELDGEGNSLPPTVFQWQDGNSGIFSAAQTQPVTQLQQGGTWLPADVNGDGLIDIVYASADETGVLLLTLQVNTGSGFTSAVPLSVPELSYGGTLLPIDMAADGTIRIVYAAMNDVDGDPQLGLTVFTAVADGSSAGYCLQAGTINGAGPSGLTFGGSLQALDVNGDGLVDLVYATAYDGVRLGLTTLLSNGTSFTALPNPLETQLTSQGQFLPLDVNGDSMTDLVFAYANGPQLQFALFRSVWGQGLVLDDASPVTVDVPLTAGGSLLPFDVNADGLGDFVYATQAPDGESLQLYTFLSNGNGFVLQNGGAPQTFDIGFGGSLQPMDVNGDGMCELVMASQNGTSIALAALQFTGSGFSPVAQQVQQSLAAFTWGGMFVPLDLTGQGRTGLMYSYGVNELSLAVVPPAGVYPDLVTQISNGLGGTFSVVHKPITDPSVYSRSDSSASHLEVQGLLNNYVSGSTFALVASGALTPGSPGATYASRTVDFPKYVVASHQIQDGQGSSYGYQHFYRGAKIDLNGRGWLGFSSVQSTDVSAGVVTDTAYSQEFPTSFLAVSNQISDASGALLRETSNTYATGALNPWPNSKISVAQATLSEMRYFSVGRSTPDRSESQAFEYDNYGGRTLLTEQGTGLSSPLYTRSSYENRTDQWILGMKIEEVQSSDPEGAAILSWVKTQYNALGQPVVHSDWDDRQGQWLPSSMAYDAYGNMLQHTAPSGAVTNYEFETEFNTFRVLMTAPANQAGVRLSSSTSWDARFGAKLLETDANGIAKGARIDSFGRVRETLGPDPTGKTVTLTTHMWVQQGDVYYEEVGTRLSWEETQWTWSRSFLDGLGRTYRAQSVSADGTGVTQTEKAYDSRNLVLRSSLPHAPAQPPIFMSYWFNSLGRLVQSVTPAPDAQWLTTTTTWDTTDHATETQGAVTNAPRVSKVEFGGFGEQQFVRTRTAADGGVTAFEYDALRRLIRVTDPNGIATTSAYDTQGRIVESAVTGNGKVYRAEHFSFADFKQTSTSHNTLGAVKTTQRDGLGRPVLQSVTGADGAGYSVTYQYDDGSAAYGLGRLTSVARSDGSFSKSFAYDPQGNSAVATVTFDGTSYTTTSRFLPTGKVEQVELPDGAIHRYSYTTGGEVNEIALADSAASLSASFSGFTPQSIPATVHYGNGVAEQNNYDPAGRLTHQNIQSTSGSVCLDIQIARDIFDQIVGLHEGVAAGQSQSFTYDPVGRLATANGAYGNESYVYDVGGNMLAKAGINFSIDGQQVIAGSAGADQVYAATYNAMGNMETRTVSGQSISFQYDPEERLLSDGSNAYQYDENGSRLKKTTADGTVTWYVSPFFEVTSFANGARQHTRYLNGTFGVMASSTVADTPIAPPHVAGVPAVGIEYLHCDHIGSTRAVTSSEGAATASAAYQPFGTIDLDESEDTFRQKFTGQERDPNNLYYFQARYYDPFTARFIGSDDRAGASLYSSDAFHRYAYVLNNPLSNLDPTGHSLGDIIGQMFVAAVAVVAGVILTPFSGALGGMLVGAGISGLTFDTQMLISGNYNCPSHTQLWNAFGIQFGIGAAVGLVTGGIGRVGGQLMGEVPTDTEGLWEGAYRASGVRSAATDLGTRPLGSGVRFAVSMSYNSLAAGVGGVLQQVMENAANNANPLGLKDPEHYDLGRGVGLSFLMGIGFGALAGGASEMYVAKYGRGQFTADEINAFRRPDVAGAGGARARATMIDLGADAAAPAGTDMSTWGGWLQVKLKVGFQFAAKNAFLAGGRGALYFISPRWPYQNW